MLQEKMTSFEKETKKKAGTIIRNEKNLQNDFLLKPTGWPYKNPFDFMDGKRVDDQVPQHLHRVHDNLYDLNSFDHPGGALWLELTRGTDITELFESHHLNYSKATSVLSKYEVKIKTKLPPRNSPLTFNKDDFYATLREKIWKRCREMSHLGPSVSASVFADIMAIFSVALTHIAGSYASSSMAWAIFFTVVLGILNGFFIGIGHNFLHQRTHWRRFYMEFSGFSCAEFRMHHALSHHPYTNTPLDAEINSLIPLGISFFPHSKSLTDKIKAGMALVFVITFGIPIRVISRYCSILTGSWRGDMMDKVAQTIPLFQLILLCNCDAGQVFAGSILWLVMLSTTSSAFLWGNFLNGPHFNDECWHHSDTLDSTDWGILQIQTNVERSELECRE